MKYSALINFESLETIIQLILTTGEKEAKTIINTYVISEEMASRMTNLIFPMLQFKEPKDNKGILIVGNYGTGKTHLMSFLSSIAENSDYLKFIKNEDVRKSAETFAGQFKVHRTEIGGVSTPLRNIIVHELEDYLASIGVSFSFPPMDTITNNKAALEDMMNAFHQKYPDQGLLFVVDELLDYLKTRKDNSIILDLNFMRELGEASKNLRFRFMAGMQEVLFESSRFSYVSDELARIQDRFKQIFIARNDVKFVVKERLLKKNTQQKAMIREHLAPFSKFYSNMNERLDEFVEMFPVHPDYVETFEKLPIVEKRGALETLSIKMSSMLDQEVPADQPGIIAYDSYWEKFCNDSTFQSNSDVNEVIKCSEILSDRIKQAISRPQYKPMALRIINGLSIHRLTTGDISAKIGATASELQNNLCLYEPMVAEMGDKDADRNLLTYVEMVLKEIIRTVSGQFITHNEDNGQYYLDIKKTQDYDAEIEKRAESLGNTQLDRAYFNALVRAMECPVVTYLTGFKIWQFELAWKEKNTGRQGYLFFGTPNERSTASPPRDFYIYFLQPYEPPHFEDENKADEVFVKLSKFDDKFTKPLKLYAAAVELANSSSSAARGIYEEKARTHLKNLVTWMQSNIFENFEATYQGSSQPIRQWIHQDGFRNLSVQDQGSINFKEIIDAVASGCLAPHFADLAPDYPKFSIMISQNNREQAAQAALRVVAGVKSTKQANAVLDALQLLDGDKISTDDSIYARHIRNLLDQKQTGQVLNHDELIIRENLLEYMDPENQRLEPEWVVVVLAAMVFCGDLILVIPGAKFDATNLQQLSATDLTTLSNFRHLEKPKDWNVPGLNALFEFFGLPTGYINSLMQNQSEGVQQLQAEVSKMIEQVLNAQQKLNSGILLWNVNLVEPAQLTTRKTNLSSLKDFLEGLQRFNTVGKLKNFKLSLEDINQQNKYKDEMQQMLKMQNLLQNFSSLTQWLSQAEAYMAPDSDWVERVQQIRETLINAAKTQDIKTFADNSLSFQQQLESLKKDYIKDYLELHQKMRLGVNDDQRKNKLVNDSRLRKLNNLSIIDLLSKQNLTSFHNKISEIKSCFSCTSAELQQSPICPLCHMKPNENGTSVSAKQKLNSLDQELDTILETWILTLLDALDDPFTKENIDLLDKARQERVNQFISSGELPEPIDKDFVITLQEILSGLEKISLTINNIKNALQQGSGAATPDEIKKRFVDYIDIRLRGKDINKIRFVIEDDTSENIES